MKTTYKKCNMKNSRCFSVNKKYRKHGATSAHLHPPQQVFRNINIEKGDYFLDLGCGIGEYSLYVSNLVGDTGKVYAVDINDTVIKELNKEIELLALKNIETNVADIAKSLPFQDDSIDVCFISTVLHTLNLKVTEDTVFGEIHRVLKPNGRLITIDCKKSFIHFGPPQEMRISAIELVEIAWKHNFMNTGYADLAYNYMLRFNSF